LHYRAEGSLARSRYRLTSMVQALRDREIAGQRRYQRAFRVFIHTWMGGTPETALSAELMANAVVTTHNHVLRQWLREKTTTPEADFDLAMARTVGMFDKGVPAAGQEASLVVLRTTKDLHEILPMLRKFTS
jgi:hypothetical protein